MADKKPKTQVPGKIKLYADENIRYGIVQVLRMQGINVKHASEVNLTNRDDKTHFQYSQKTDRWLLTTDKDFLNNELYPIELIKGIIVVPNTGNDMAAGYILAWLKEELVPSGKGLDHCKVEFRIHSAVFHFKSEGKMITQQIGFT